MPNYQRNEIVPGLFVLAATAVFGLYAFRVGRWEILDFFKGRRVLCRTVFDEVKTLAVGARVSVAGRRVGAVSRLRWTEKAYSTDDMEILRRQLGALPEGIHEGTRRLVVEVDFELNDATLTLDPASAQVAILQDGFLGQHFLDLYPGYWVADREPVPVLVAGLAEPVPVRARRAPGLDVLAAGISDAVASLNTLIKTLNEGVLNQENRDHLNALLKSMTGAAEAARNLLTVEQAEGLHQNAIQPLRRMLDSASEALARLRDSTLPKTDQLLDESRAGVQEFRTTMGKAQTDLHAVLAQLEGTLVDTRPELAESMRRLRETLWQVDMAVRKVRSNPSVLLFGKDEPDLEARELDESGARGSGRAKIFRQRDESASGK